MRQRFPSELRETRDLFPEVMDEITVDLPFISISAQKTS
jgi:hypothetical protein